MVGIPRLNGMAVGMVPGVLHRLQVALKPHPIQRWWPRHCLQLETATEIPTSRLELHPLQGAGQLLGLGVGVAGVALQVGMAAELHAQLGWNVRRR